MTYKPFLAHLLELGLQSAGMNDQLTAEDQAAAVREWVDSHIGPTKRFRSPHQWVLVAGLSAGGMDTIRRGGIPKALTLRALAEAVDEDPAVVLAKAGYINLDGGQLVLSNRERRLVESFRELAARDQDAIVRATAGLLRSDEDSN